MPFIYFKNSGSILLTLLEMTLTFGTSFSFCKKENLFVINSEMKNVSWNTKSPSLMFAA